MDEVTGTNNDYRTVYLIGATNGLLILKTQQIKKKINKKKKKKKKAILYMYKFSKQYKTIGGGFV